LLPTGKPDVAQENQEWVAKMAPNYIATHKNSHSDVRALQSCSANISFAPFRKTLRTRKMSRLNFHPVCHGSCQTRVLTPKND
jgi:hypothetical protein